MKANHVIGVTALLTLLFGANQAFPQGNSAEASAYSARVRPVIHCRPTKT